MTVQDFIDLYNTYEGEAENIELEITEYVPFAQKVDLCRAIIEDSTYDKDKNFKMNSALRNVLYRMVLVDTYTNIDIDFGNAVKEYDLLESEYALTTLLSQIDEEEIRRFDEIMQCELNDLYQNERSHAAIARRNG